MTWSTADHIILNEGIISHFKGASTANESLLTNQLTQQRTHGALLNIVSTSVVGKIQPVTGKIDLPFKHNMKNGEWITSHFK